MKLSKREERTNPFWASGLAVMMAFMLDCIGEPPARCHPVVWYGKLIRFLEQHAPQSQRAQLLYGVGMLLFAKSCVLPPALLIHKLALWIARFARPRTGSISVVLLYAYIEGVSLKPFFALRMLADAGKQVRVPLTFGDIPAARQALQSLVSRDRSQLSAELIAAAAIESLAENLSDSVIAPLFFYALFGLPGAALYRLCNTFDSMIGYHGQYEYLGKPAARLDDLLNWLPARLTALLISICAPLYGGSCRGTLFIWRRDARKTASPNAGQPMSAAAGALGIQLEKVGHYTLGDNERPIVPDDIRRAEYMVWYVGSLAIALTIISKTFWRGWYE